MKKLILISALAKQLSTIKSKSKIALWIIFFSPLLMGGAGGGLFAQDNVGMGTNTPDPSAILELRPPLNDKGLLIPRLTTAQRLAIPAPANGLLVYDTTLDCFFYYTTASGWISLCQLSGPAGPTGPTGASGTAGTNGATGPTGAQGATGTAGTTGATGLPGDTGPTGATGTAGTNGATGATGATGSAGTNGATGATGVTGSAGANGATGATGVTGSAGTNGATGATGVTGSAGTNGATGATGVTGSAGVNGATGATGANGSNGATGPTGPSNVFKYSVAGTTDINIPTNAVFVAMSQMSITFTPVNPTVIVHFTAGGTYLTSNFNEHTVWFELRRGATLIKEFDTHAGEDWNLWDIAATYPVSVTVGLPTTISINWAADQGGGAELTIYNNVATQTYSHRSLVIVDAP